MPVSWISTYRALLLVSLVVGLFLLYQAATHRDRPGAKPLFILVAGALLYVSVKLMISTVRGTPAVLLVTRFNPLGAGLATVGFFLIAVEYTGVENPVSKRTTAGVVLVPAVVSTLALIDPGYLWVLIGPDASTLSGYVWEHTGLALANQLYMNLLLLVGTGLLVRRGIQSPNVFTVQAGALVLSALGPLAGNLAFQFGYVQFNPTPVVFMISGALIAWAILRAGFLDLIPVERKTVLDQFDAGVVTLDDDHRVIDINERGCQLFDVDNADTVVGDHVDEAFADRPTFRELYWTVTASDSGHESSVESDGRYYAVEVIPLSSSKETILGRSMIIRDVTGQKRRERELEELTTRFELALEGTDTGVWEWNLETDELVWDEASERLFGYAPGEFPGTFEGIADRVPDEDLDTIQRKVDTAIETGHEYRADFRVRADDEQRWVHARGVVKSSESGEPVRMFGIQTDITEQKERERALERARKELRQVIDLIPDPLYAKNRNDEVLLSNEANAELHDLTPDRIEGEHEREFIVDVENIEDYDTYRQREIEVMERGEPMVFEEELQGPDGEDHVFNITRIPFETTGSDEDAVLGYARDVTDIKEYELELEETKRTLEQSNERLDQFASTVSHDLRNPLNVAQERLKLAQMETDSEHLEAAEKAHERIEAMIDDLLTLARQGDVIEETDSVDLGRLTEATWQNVATAEATLTLETDQTIRADSSRLKELLGNLFRNAVEHAGEDVTVTVGEVAGGFYVADDGPGIPGEERGDVFEAGYSTADAGTGFGLNIVREIAEAHGWEIRVTDSESGGARFGITNIKMPD